MKLSKMEQRLLNVMGSDYVSSTVLMDRLYEGLRRPKTVTIPSMVSRLRAKGIKIETLRGKGYRMAVGTSVLVHSTEIRGMMARHGLNFSVVADLAMKAIRAIATPAPSYLLTAPPKYGAIDYIKGADGVYTLE
jgi:biotin operon repressor